MNEKSSYLLATLLGMPLTYCLLILSELNIKCHYKHLKPRVTKTYSVNSNTIYGTIFLEVENSLVVLAELRE